MAARDDDDDEPRSRKRRRDDDDDDEKEDEKPAPKKSNTIWFVLAGVGLVAIFGCCCLPGGGYFYWDYTTKRTAEERQKKVEGEPGLAVDATVLSLDYQMNVANADAKYKDKVLIVTGRPLGPIGPDAVVLQPGVPEGKLVIGGVHCSFEKYKSQLATMKAQDNLKIKGYCTGAGMIHPVLLVHCKKVD